MEPHDTYHFSVMVQLKILHRVTVDAATKVQLIHSMLRVPVRTLGLEHKPLVVARGRRQHDCHTSRLILEVVGCDRDGPKTNVPRYKVPSELSAIGEGVDVHLCKEQRLALA